MTTPTTPSLLDIFDTFAALHPHPSEASFTLRDHLRAAISTLSAKDAELEALREQGRVDRVAAGAIRDSLEGEVAALRKDVSKWQDDFLALHDQLAAATARADEMAARCEALEHIGEGLAAILEAVGDPATATAAQIRAILSATPPAASLAAHDQRVLEGAWERVKEADGCGECEENMWVRAAILNQDPAGSAAPEAQEGATE